MKKDYMVIDLRGQGKDVDEEMPANLKYALEHGDMFEANNGKCPF